MVSQIKEQWDILKDPKSTETQKHNAAKKLDSELENETSKVRVKNTSYKKYLDAPDTLESTPSKNVNLGYLTRYDQAAEKLEAAYVVADKLMLKHYPNVDKYNHGAIRANLVSQLIEIAKD